MDGAQVTSSALEESIATLTGLARGRFGRIQPRRIAEHIVHQMPEAEWSILRAALDALARRYSFARRDGLSVTVRPKRGAVHGTFRTKSKVGERTRTRPYDTELSCTSPLRVSCSCADFVRSSLGLCKHGLVVLDTLEASGALARAKTETDERSSRTLTWDAQQPLLGSTDRLERLRIAGGNGARALSAWKDGRPLRRQLRSPEQRLAVVVALDKLIRRGSLETEPAVITLLSEEKARAERLADAEAAAPTLLKSLKTLQRKLYPYQRDGVRRFFEAGRLLLADDMGLGKTTQAIAACHALLETRRISRGLLIVPASLKRQWKREWEATTHLPLQLVEGSPEERKKHYVAARRGILVIGYEQLLRDFEQIARFAPELVVLDEAQRIKNWATKSAAYVKALAPAYRLVLTGTPLENRYDELASIMDFVDDLALEPKWRLTPLHSVTSGDGSKGATGARHLSALRARLAPVMLRRVRREVLAQLPSRVDTRVPVELTAPQRDAHDDLRQPIAQLLGVAARRPLKQAEFLRLMQMLTRQRMICNGLAQVQFEQEWPRCQTQVATPSVLESLFAPKLATLRGLVEQVVIGQQRKAVVFSQWRNMLRLSEWAIRDQLEAEGLRAVFFTGAESSAMRERAIVELHDDPRVAVMFLSDAGGIGLNLQRAANCCINLELPWNPAVLEQRIGRIYRLGQTSPIDVYNLVSEGGIEARIAALVERKRAVFSGLFDGTTDTVMFEGQASFLDGIRTLVEPVPVPMVAADDVDAQELVAAAEEPASSAPGPTSSVAAQLTIERLDDGSLRIAAPPELAAPMAALLEQLARGLLAATERPS
jgi:superfamily II DNA or RNA helicase